MPGAESSIAVAPSEAPAELVWNNPALTSVATDITSLSGNINESVTRNPDLTGSYAQHEDTGNGASYSPGTANTGQ